MGFVQHHGRCHFFAQRGMGTAEGHRGGDCRMLQQNLVYFMRCDVLAAANDDVLDAAAQV